MTSSPKNRSVRKGAASPVKHGGGRHSFLGKVLRDPLLFILLAALGLLTALAPEKISTYPSLVDWSTIAMLTGLLALTKALELSGALAGLGQWLLCRLTTERAAAVGLVLAAALLSMVVTNDVALFVVVPLTLGLCRTTGMPSTRLIIFEALAVNAGSALTPIGNPQNLFLWQLSGVSFATFVGRMLPLVAVLMLVLLALTMLVSRPRPMPASSAALARVDRGLMLAAIVLYLPFLVAADKGYAAWALIVVLGLMLLLRPSVLAQMDWGLLLVFVLMFIDLRLFAGLGVVRHAMAALDFGSAKTVYAAGVAASQVISNVPAAIALAEYSKDWKALAYGVNVGGFGVMLGSLANLIALRMADDRTAWLRFHAYSMPFLVAATAAGYLLLF